MNTEQKLRHALRIGTGGVLILAILGTGPVTATGQQNKALPDLLSASMPLYPRTPQMAHIEGVVRLRISTNGNRVASVEVQSGQPMLAQAAQDNVKTWEFEQHDPTTFEATFRYKLLPSKCDAKCNCDSVEKPSVFLQLPNVEVNGKELMVCDSGTKR
jgi:TonB family protein